MTTEASNKGGVFISYCHKDKGWREHLETHLKPYIRSGSVTAWSDQQIKPGSKWHDEIKAALASAKVAVLLVTPNFLASDFIYEEELTPLLKEAERGGVQILWVPVRPSAYEQSPLKNYQAAIDPVKPLALMKAQRDAAWVEICRKIAAAANP
jgi:internalin A